MNINLGYLEKTDNFLSQSANLTVSLSTNNGISSIIMRNEIAKLIAICSRMFNDWMRMANAKPGMNVVTHIKNM